MISPAQRLLNGMAPPLLAVHVMLQGLAPFASTTVSAPNQDIIVGWHGSRQQALDRMTGAERLTRQLEEEDEAILLAVIKAVLDST